MQLGVMRDENRRVWEQLAAERRRVEKLVGVVGRLWDVVGKGFPGSGKFCISLDMADPSLLLFAKISDLGFSVQSHRSLRICSTPMTAPTSTLPHQRPPPHGSPLHYQ